MPARAIWQSNDQVTTVNQVVVTPVTNAGYPEPDIPTTDGIELNTTQLRRLRWYHRRGNSKNHAHCDATDPELLRVGAINYTLTHNSEYVRITRLGLQLLAEDTERTRENRAPHNQLAHRLAGYLRGMGRLTWENIEFKSAPGYLVRPDVFSVVSTHTESRLAPTVHEVKVSRADFLADVSQPQKREGYFKIASRVFYCAPEGIIEPHEVPADCGLLVEEASGHWRMVCRGKHCPVKLTAWHYMNLLLKRPTN